MFKILISTLSLVLISCSTARQSGTTENILREYKYVKLSNGLTVLYVPDYKLPYLTMTLFVKAGNQLDPQGKSGVSSLMMDMLDKGTQTRTAEKISDEIEGLGAEFSVSTSHASLSAGIDGLSFHEDKLLENFVDLLFHPSFDAQEFKKIKTRTIASLQQAFNQSSYLAERAFKEFYFGKNPNSKPEEGYISEVKKIGLEDIKEAYKNHFRPKESLLVVTGKFSPKFQNKLKSYFSIWKDPEIQNAPEPEKTPVFTGVEILLVDKPDLNQADIAVAHPGILRTNPDYMTAQVANSILGMGFTSRLVDRIRDQKGLTYSISSQFETMPKEGVFMIDTFTQTNRVGEMLREIKSVYEVFYDKGVTESEVNIAKGYMSGKFPMLLETADKTAYNLAHLNMFGITEDYLINYQKNLRAISAKDVNDKIKIYFQPQNLKIVIVGNSAQIEPQLKGLGNLQKVSYKAYLK